MKTKFHNRRWLTGNVPSRCFLSRKNDPGKNAVFRNTDMSKILGLCCKKCTGNRTSGGKILVVPLFSQWIVRLTDKDGNHLQMWRKTFRGKFLSALLFKEAGLPCGFLF